MSDERKAGAGLAAASGYADLKQQIADKVIREYHTQLSKRLDVCIRANKKPELEDLCGASAAVLSLALNGIRATEDQARIDWLERECRAGRVLLSINNQPRGYGKSVRAAIDDAIRHNDRTELPPPDSDGGSRKEQSNDK